MDFHQLKIFLEVVRHKSFSKAANSIFLSQPTVSAHIKALENEVGVPLIDRCQRELQLTNAGETLFQYAQQLLDTKEKALFAIQQEYRIIQGHLEIAASSVPGTYFLPGLMKGFLQHHSQVTFAVILNDTAKVYENVLGYTHDLGFVGEPNNLNELKQIRLWQDELILICAPDMHLPGAKVPDKKQDGINHQPLSSELPELDIISETDGEAFLNVPFILREPGSATRMIFENALGRLCNKKDLALNIVAYLEGQEAIKEAIKIGLGVTVISRKAVEHELQTGLIKGYRLPGLNLKRHFYLIYRKNRVFSPLTQAFIDHCISLFPPAPPTAAGTTPEI